MNIQNHEPTWRGRPIPLTRYAIEAEIERLIELLDVADGDPDLEDDKCDDEPSLGWCGNHPLSEGCGGYVEPSLAVRTAVFLDECEQENEHGGDVLDEPHDALDEGNDEPFLGWMERDGQLGIGTADWGGDPTFDIAPSYEALVFDGKGRREARRMLQVLA